MNKSKNKKKLCQACGCKNKTANKICIVCKAKKFAPTFVRELDKVTRQFYVQITDPYEKGNPKRITLYKWWPGNHATLHINTQEQWGRIKAIIDQKFAKYLNWKSKKEILKQIKQFERDEKKTEVNIKKLAQDHPRFVTSVLKKLDLSKIKETDYQDIVAIFNDLISAVTKSDHGFRSAFRKVIQELPKQPKRAIEDLTELLKTWSLKQVTAITYQVIDRLETLKLFKERVLDDKTYEIRGDNSIHRILERAMWIVDERYWLLHSNETLRKIVEKELPKKDKKYKKKRPDFVCGSVGNKMIIIELKRPSHTLKVDDLNQLETYLSIIEDHQTISSFEAYLVGRKVSDEVRKRIKYRGAQFKIKTFSELIDDTEKRYSEFLKAVEK